MKNKQYGAGLVACLFALLIIIIFTFTAYTIAPLYGEKFVVLAAMKTIATMPDAKSMSKKRIRTYLRRNIEISSSYKRFSTEKALKKSVNTLKNKKTKKVYLHVTYEARENFFKDLYFVLPFDHKVELPR